MKAAGTAYLHNWLNTLVDQLFIQKVWYKLYYFKTPNVYAPEDWVPFPFHLDLTNSPDKWMHKNLHDRALISILVPVGSTSVSLDIGLKEKETGHNGRKWGAPVSGKS